LNFFSNKLEKEGYNLEYGVVNALKEYQKDHGLDDLGYLNANTVRQIKNDWDLNK
jgi:uncharacterized membrane protein YqiK